MELVKIVTSSEMARVEAKSIHEGADPAEYMRLAGLHLAAQVDEYIKEHKKEERLLLLCGRGNNGGDAFAMAEILAKQKYRIKAYILFEDKELSTLNLFYKKRCIKAGIEVILIRSAYEITIEKEDIIIDGLLGTGFHGTLEGLMSEVVERANASHNPIIAIDIPSGLSGNDGCTDGSIMASLTICLGLPKIGLFINKGFDRVGVVRVVNFGMLPKFADEMETAAQLLISKSLKLPPIKRSRHKYQAGYVLAFSGSVSMPGAAALSTLAALRGGAGIVRLYSALGTVCPQLSAEVIHCHFDTADLSPIYHELKRASSLYFGPGLGRGSDVKALLDMLLKEANIPIILDADGLFLLGESDLRNKKIVLTPHRKEALRLMGVPDGDLDDRELFTRLHNYVNYHGVIVVLKGAPTFIFRKDAPVVIVDRGSPGMATAGSGDVLTGLLSALVATGGDLFEKVALAVALHAIAGEIAAIEMTPYCMIASDIIAALPESFSSLE
jgi:NAD(P)H-hydrate epimerase